MSGFTLRVLLIGEFADLPEFSELALHQPLAAISIHPHADPRIVKQIDSSQFDVISIVIQDPIEDSLELIRSISNRVETPIMGILQDVDDSLERELFVAGCRHCFSVAPWTPQALADAIHETARRDPLLCELMEQEEYCAVNWQPNFFGWLLAEIQSNPEDARKFFDEKVPLQLAAAAAASLTNPQYDLQHEAIMQRFSKLTNKEILILMHVLQGKPSAQVAEETGVSDNTIRSQRIAALRKLDARTPIELATAFVTIGFQHYLKQLKSENPDTSDLTS
jgi:DNA-binding NarL/FixJ family response regulator